MPTSKLIPLAKREAPPANDRIARLRKFADRARPIMERQMVAAEELAAIMKDMREAGERGAMLKKWIKAEITYARTGDDRELQNLLKETQHAVFYGVALGHGDAGPMSSPATKTFCC